MNRRLLALFSAVLAVLLLVASSATAPALAQGEPGLTEAMTQAFRAVYKDDIILTAADMGVESCGQQEGHPGIVRGDFNGDGREDVALLFRRKEKESTWALRSDSWRQIRVILTTLIDNGKGGYNLHTIGGDLIALPSPYAISLAPPGTYYDTAKEVEVTTRFDGIRFGVCGQIASAYYWTADKPGWEEVTLDQIFENLSGPEKEPDSDSLPE